VTIYYKSPEEFAEAQNVGTRRTYTVGVDLGQTTDPTAIAIIERELVPGGIVRLNRANQDGSETQLWDQEPRNDRVTYVLRHLERLPLGTSYTAQVQYVHSMMGRPPLSSSQGASLIIDQTGVGRAVFDMFKGVGLSPTGCTITAGENETRTRDGWRVAKLQLVSRLQAMLHSGELEIASDLPDLAALKAELQNFRVNFTDRGSMTFAARVGAHDDLVLAVAIALWHSEHSTRQTSGQKSF
jgi:hypothetical protein